MENGQGTRNEVKGTRDKEQGKRNKGNMISGLGFEDLDVWKRSVVLSSEIYKYFKNCKDYGFKDQITRSGLSIPSNISEGYERYSKKEKHQFYSIAKGSAGELRTQCIIGKKISYISEEIANKWIGEAKEISSMLSGLMKSVREK